MFISSIFIVNIRGQNRVTVTYNVNPVHTIFIQHWTSIVCSVSGPWKTPRCPLKEESTRCIVVFTAWLLTEKITLYLFIHIIVMLYLASLSSSQITGLFCKRNQFRPSSKGYFAWLVSRFFLLFSKNDWSRSL